MASANYMGQMANTNKQSSSDNAKTHSPKIRTHSQVVTSSSSNQRSPLMANRNQHMQEPPNYQHLQNLMGTKTSSSSSLQSSISGTTNPQHHQQQIPPPPYSHHHQQVTSSERYAAADNNSIHSRQHDVMMDSNCSSDGSVIASGMNKMHLDGAGAAKHEQGAGLTSITSEQQLCMLYNAQQHSDYIISDYMDKIATRINILETELKFAWRALDLLSNEYGKMWNRLEKLENITVEQQSVVGNIMELYGRGRGASELLSNNGSQIVVVHPDDDPEALMQQNFELNYDEEDIQQMQPLGVAPPSALEFNDMLEELKNDALDTNLLLMGSYSKMMEQQQHTAAANRSKSPAINVMNNEFVRNDGYDEIAASVNEGNLLDFQRMRAAVAGKEFEDLIQYMERDQKGNAVMIRDLLGNGAIKDGLEEGIDLMQRERLLKMYRNDMYQRMAGNIDQPTADGIFKAQMDNRMRSDSDFFRSGELNRDIFSNIFQTNDGGGAGSDDFFRQTTDSGGGGGGGGNDVVMMEGNDEEMNEEFYRSLNQAYRDDGFNPMSASNVEIILPHKEPAVGEHVVPSRPVSSLGMIYEDNEEQEPDHQSSASEVDEFLHFGDGNKKLEHNSNVSIAQCTSSQLSQTKHKPRLESHGKRSKKKKHHKNEMELLNNLKTAIAGDQIIDGIVTSTSASQSGNDCSSPPKPMNKDELIALIMKEIGKVEDLTQFSQQQFDNLRAIIEREYGFFEKIKKINKNLILLLLNPISRSDSFDDSDQRYKQLTEKLQKNIEIIKKLLGNDYQTMGAVVDAKPTADIDLNVKNENFSELDSLKQRYEMKSNIDNVYTSAIFDGNNSRSSSNRNLAQQSTTLTDDYSRNLLQNNSQLNAQLKILESKEHEIIQKSLRNINQMDEYYAMQQQKSSIIPQLDNMSRNNLLDNFDEKTIISEKCLLDEKLAQFNLINNDERNAFLGGNFGSATHYSSNSSIYSNDEYIKSLKKSLERHNSMLFLLHLQNPNYRGPGGSTGTTEDFAIIDDDRISNGSHSPPPPAPNGEDSVPNEQSLQKQQIVNLPMSAMNPFHADIMSLNEELHQQRLDIEHNQQQQNMLRTHIESSPKKTKSDSGLSSMSGFSSLEKSPNSPGNKQLNRQQLHYSTGSCTELPKHLASGFNENDFMFSEENLNYIRELSKNVPICSVYENKSIFDEDERQRSRKHSHGSSYQLSSASASQYGSQGNFPDLVQDQTKDLKYYSDTHKMQQHAPSPSPSRRSMSQGPSYYDEPPIEVDDDYKRTHPHQQKHKQLTDRLVFYPSSSKITDYNSSMNLDYTGRLDDIRRQQQHPQQYNLPQAMSQDPKNFTNLDRHQQNIKHYMQTLQTIQGRSQDSRSYPRNGATSMRYGSLDSQQAPALPAHQNQQHSYLLNQSGYVTISSDLKEKLQPQQSNHHHQSASSTSTHNNSKLVSKFSHWLPDLKLKKMSKRHRSHSLPAGVEIDDDIPQSTANKHQSNTSAQQKLRKDSSSSSGVSTNASTKKKKRSLVSTMSNIMQKAKSINRRHSFTHHSFTNPFSHHKHVGAYTKHPHSASLSDPEGDVHGFFSDNDDTTSTSEYEKQSLLDEYGGFGDMQHDQQAMLFPTMSSAVRVNEQQKSVPEYVEQESEVKKPSQPPVSDSDDSGGEIFMNPMFATVGEATKPYSGGENSGEDNVSDPKVATATSTSITVVTPSPDPSSSNTTNGDPNNKFIFSSTSMEFAVSRKIAKYRQKNVSSDDINGQKHSDDGGDSSEQQNTVVVLVPPTTMTTPIRPLEHQKSLSHVGQLQKTHSIFVEDDSLPIANFGNAPTSTGFDRQPATTQNVKANLLDTHSTDPVTITPNNPRNYKFGQKSQQSLDIPSSRDDEDNRSQHSYRTMSSSRRQSTEDSIDTDDEYFVYELRKLEELERRSHMESSTYYDDGGHEGEQLLNKIDQLAIDEDDEYTMLNERKCYQPDEDVKEKMSFVLNELKNVVKLQPEIKVNNVRRRSDAEKGQAKKSNVYEKFSHASDISWQNKTYDEDEDDFLGEIDQLEKEIKNQHYGKQAKPIKMRKKRRKSPNYGDSYDSDEPDEYSSTPYSSEDEANKPGKTSRDSSEATSGPDSPCHFTDDDLDHTEAFRKMEDYDEFKERQKTELTASKNDVAVSPNEETMRETDERVDESFGTNENRRISSDEQQYQSDELGVGESDVGEMGTELIKSVRKMPGEKMLSHESSQDSQNGILGSSKWKLLKTLKEKKIEEKNNQDKIKEEECTQKDKDKVNYVLELPVDLYTTKKLNFNKY